MARRGRRMWAGRQADSRVASHRLAVALFCALALFFIAGSLLWSLPVKAAATPTTFYGVSDSRVLANSLVDTPTSTNTPAPTPTDTPAPTATDTPAPAATNTPAPTATPSNPYALNVTGAASGAGWPQHYSNWCRQLDLAAGDLQHAQQSAEREHVGLPTTILIVLGAISCREYLGRLWHRPALAG